MIPHITKTLNHNSFSFYTQLKSLALHHIWNITNFTNAIINTQSRGFLSAPYAALGNRLSGNTSQRINFAGAHTHISIQYPGHFAFAGSVIGSWNIGTRTYEVFLDEFRRVPARDFFEVVR